MSLFTDFRINAFYKASRTPTQSLQIAPMRAIRSWGRSLHSLWQSHPIKSWIRWVTIGEVWISTSPFFCDLIIHLASPVSLFAFLSFGLVPIPLIFLRYGEKLRRRSYYANEAARVLSELNASTTADTGNLSVEKVYSQGIEEGSDKASGDGSEMA